jgi:ligand-binding sensor domain-containing protein
MFRSVGIVIVSVIFSASFSPAQQIQVGQWKSYTDMRSVRSIALSSSGIVAATGGGMFRYSGRSASYARWTNAEQLSTNDLTALTIDRNNRIWVGSSNGAVDVLDASTGIWTSIKDIANSNRPQKAIRRFLAKGDSVFIASDFGVSVFIASRWEFGDTYADFGFPSQPSLSDVIVNGTTIYVGTDQGVAVASLNSPNLSAPTSWTVYAKPQGLASTAVKSMSVFRDTLLVGTSDGIFSFNGFTFQQLGSTSGKSVASIFSSQNVCTYVWNSSPGFTVESKSSVGGPISIIANSGTGQATALAVDSVGSTTFVGTSDQGVVEWNGSQWTQRAPNGPQANLFISLCVDGNGVLWAGSGIDGGG